MGLTVADVSDAFLAESLTMTNASRLALAYSRPPDLRSYRCGSASSPRPITRRVAVVAAVAALGIILLVVVPW